MAKRKKKRSPHTTSQSKQSSSAPPTVTEGHVDANADPGVLEPLVSALNIDVDNVRDKEQQQEQEPYGASIADAMNSIHIHETHISELEASIDKIKKSIAKLEQSVDQINSHIDLARIYMGKLETAGFSAFEEHPFLWDVLDPTDSITTMRSNLRKDINDEKAHLREEKAHLRDEKARRDEKEIELKLERERLVLLRRNFNDEAKSGGIHEAPTKEIKWKSGLLHVEETLQISFAKDQSIHVGMINHTASKKPPFERRDIGIWVPIRELVDAWHLTNTEMAETDFFENLYFLTQRLNKERLENACRALNFKFHLKKNDAGEMLMQQQLLSPFTMLLNAAASDDGVEADHYKADENVCASLAVECKEKEDGDSVLKQIRIKPDAAVTLKPGWDIFGMIEMKRTTLVNKVDLFHDMDKCAMMTAITATIVGTYLQEETLREEVAIPFIMAGGKDCSLYVTTLDKNKNPCIKVVQFPEEEKGVPLRSDFNDLRLSPSKARVRFFVTFAILLNKFKTLFENHVREEYEGNFGSIFQKVDGYPKYSLMNWPSAKEPPTQDSQNVDSSAKTPQQQGPSAEISANKAAECGDIFSDVKYPFIRKTDYTDYGMVDSIKVTSPFYFRAHSTARAEGMTTKEVFLKVWQEKEVDLEHLRLEWENHRLAFKTGVPVAAPVFDTLVRSTSSDGSTYLVFATEYLHKDTIQDKTDFLQFCTSLIEAVIKLHEEAGLLHCDIKPDNLCWGNKVVRLIDFGHSQQVQNAVWSRGTEGFEAPEIIESRMPCSTKTDAFSVGATILRVLKGLHKSIQQQDLCHIIHDIALRLKDFDPGTRWTLPQALHKVHNIQVKQGSPSLQVKQFKVHPVSNVRGPSYPVEAE